MERLRTSLLPVLFMAMLLTPLVNSIFGIWTFDRKDENRAFAKMPTLNIEYLDPFPEEYEEYYRDNFSFRTPLLKLYHHYKFFFAKVSPDPTKTVIGKDGWYFMAGKEKQIIEGKLDFTPDQLEAYRKEWAYRLRLMDSLGVKACHWMIIPITQYVYPEKMEFNTVWSDRPRRIDVLHEYLNKHFPDLVIDPLPQLLAAKDSMKVYRMLDNHWNHRGALIASQVLIGKLREQFPQLQIPDPRDYEWRDTVLNNGHHRAVLGNDALCEAELHPFPLHERNVPAPLYGFPPVPEFPYPWEHELRFVVPLDTVLPRIVIIRDSFTGMMMPFLKDHFAESVFIFDSWHFHANPKIIARVRPDIVIYCTMEANMEGVIGNHSEP
ncbi:MAG: hypothetical protein K9J06_02215 [Flavobacteriales bacterium]|nr:hypothetical protein [Flavobacteriales bacterium]